MKSAVNFSKLMGGVLFILSVFQFFSQPLFAETKQQLEDRFKQSFNQMIGDPNNPLHCVQKLPDPQIQNILTRSTFYYDEYFLKGVSLHLPLGEQTSLLMVNTDNFDRGLWIDAWLFNDSSTPCLYQNTSSLKSLVKAAVDTLTPFTPLSTLAVRQSAAAKLPRSIFTATDDSAEEPQKPNDDKTTPDTSTGKTPEQTEASDPVGTSSSVPTAPRTPEVPENPTITQAGSPLAGGAPSHEGKINGNPLGITNPQAVTGTGCSLDGSASHAANPFACLFLILLPVLLLEILRRALITQEDVDGWFKGLSFPLEF